MPTSTAGQKPMVGWVTATRYAPSRTTEPCAKFSTPVEVNTMAKPAAMRLSTSPKDRPLRTWVRK